VKPNITILGLLASLVVSSYAFAQSDMISFKLVPNPKFEACLGVPSGPAPTATATVVRGKLNDTLVLRVRNVRPNLQFDLFTVQRTSYLQAERPIGPSTMTSVWHGINLTSRSTSRATC
jgi:hypothetical protein